MIARVLAFVRRKPAVVADAPPFTSLADLPKRTPKAVEDADRAFPNCYRCDGDTMASEGRDAIFETVECTNCNQRFRLAHFGSDGGTVVLQVLAYRGKNDKSKSA